MPRPNESKQVLKLALFCWLLFCTPVWLHAQRPGETLREQQDRLARRAIGARLGAWDVGVDGGADSSRSPEFGLFLQRGLDAHVLLQNSVGLWWVTTRALQADPELPEIVTRIYVVPLLTTLKWYPATTPADRIEPFVEGGIGIVFGIEDVGENAIGGGGTSIVTGFGARAAVGAEIRLSGPWRFVAGGSYQWAHFGEDLGSTDTIGGVGVAGGFIYGLQF